MKNALKYIIFLSTLTSIFVIVYNQSDKKGLRRWLFSLKVAVVIALGVLGLTEKADAQPIPGAEGFSPSLFCPGKKGQTYNREITNLNIHSKPQFQNRRNNAQYNGVAKDGSIVQASQVQKKYKHAKDFGILGPYNKQNANLFKNAIVDHINSPEVRVIDGSYRREPVRHYLRKDGLLVMVRESTNTFLSCWQLDPTQETDLLTKGFFQ